MKCYIVMEGYVGLYCHISIYYVGYIVISVYIWRVAMTSLRRRLYHLGASRRLPRSLHNGFNWYLCIERGGLMGVCHIDKEV
jgi:hypothetical protein